MPSLVLPRSTVSKSLTWATILHLDPVGLWIFSVYITKLIFTGFIQWEKSLDESMIYISGDM